MFSGQGSQYYQMGRALFDAEPTFRSWMLRLDDVARKMGGPAVLETLYAHDRRRQDAFDRTLLTHPAIFMVEFSLAQALLRAGLVPQLVMGVSLGSFAAAAISGAIDSESALRAVIRQATDLEAHCEEGAMIAVLAEPALYEDAELKSASELVAINFAQHFVIAAPQRSVPAIEAHLRAMEVTFQRLPVRFAFHSRWIDAARAPFQATLRGLQCQATQLPFMCCEQAAFAPTLSEDFFWTVIRKPIRFREAIVALEQIGPHHYVDVGPGGTLATFLKYSLSASSRSTTRALLSPYGRELQELSQLQC
jgi:acyl transferase domain-containing protein